MSWRVSFLILVLLINKLEVGFQLRNGFLGKVVFGSQVRGEGGEATGVSGVFVKLFDFDTQRLG